MLVQMPVLEIWIFYAIVHRWVIRFLQVRFYLFEITISYPSPLTVPGPSSNGASQSTDIAGMGYYML